MDLVGPLRRQESELPRGLHFEWQSFARRPEPPDLVRTEHAVASPLDAGPGRAGDRIHLDDLVLDGDVEELRQQCPRAVRGDRCRPCRDAVDESSNVSPRDVAHQLMLPLRQDVVVKAGLDGLPALPPLRVLLDEGLGELRNGVGVAALLLVLGGIDAVREELARVLHPLACVGEAERRVVAECDPPHRAVDAVAKAPRLHAARRRRADAKRQPGGVDDVARRRLGLQARDGAFLQVLRHHVLPLQLYRPFGS